MGQQGIILNKVYKIRDIKTGLFKRKGNRTYKGWSEGGDTYLTLGLARSALTNMLQMNDWKYSNKEKAPQRHHFEIAEFELNETGQTF